MPRLTNSVPKYRKHRASGQAVVSLGGKVHYLGPHGTAASRREYDRLISEWLSAGRSATSADQHLTFAQLITAYWQFAKDYYPTPGGKLGGELWSIRVALRYLKNRYAHCDANEFGPVPNFSLHKFP